MPAFSRKAAFFDLDGTLAVHNLPPAQADADAQIEPGAFPTE